MEIKPAAPMVSVVMMIEGFKATLKYMFDECGRAEGEVEAFLAT